MRAEEQNQDLSGCFNANSILLLHWAFSSKKMFGKSSKNFLVFVLIDAVFLHHWRHLKVARQKVVGEGNILVSWYLCSSTGSRYFTFTALFNSESVHLFNHLYQYEVLPALPFVPPSLSAVNLTHCGCYDYGLLWLSDIHISINISKTFVGVLIFLKIC